MTRLRELTTPDTDRISVGASIHANNLRSDFLTSSGSFLNVHNNTDRIVILFTRSAHLITDSDGLVTELNYTDDPSVLYSTYNRSYADANYIWLLRDTSSSTKVLLQYDWDLNLIGAHPITISGVVGSYICVQNSSRFFCNIGTTVYYRDIATNTGSSSVIYASSSIQSLTCSDQLLLINYANSRLYYVNASTFSTIGFLSIGQTGRLIKTYSNEFYQYNLSNDEVRIREIYPVGLSVTLDSDIIRHRGLCTTFRNTGYLEINSDGEMIGLALSSVLGADAVSYSNFVSNFSYPYTLMDFNLPQEWSNTIDYVSITDSVAYIITNDSGYYVNKISKKPIKFGAISISSIDTLDDPDGAFSTFTSPTGANAYAHHGEFVPSVGVEVYVHGWAFSDFSEILDAKVIDAGDLSSLTLLRCYSGYGYFLARIVGETYMTLYRVDLSDGSYITHTTNLFVDSAANFRLIPQSSYIYLFVDNGTYNKIQELNYGSFSVNQEWDLNATGYEIQLNNAYTDPFVWDGYIWYFSEDGSADLYITSLRLSDGAKVRHSPDTLESYYMALMDDDILFNSGSTGDEGFITSSGTVTALDDAVSYYNTAGDRNGNPCLIKQTDQKLVYHSSADADIFVVFDRTSNKLLRVHNFYDSRMGFIKQLSGTTLKLMWTPNCITLNFNE